MRSISPTAARTVCVLAVLFGLFGMHGMTSSAAGCHADGMAAASGAMVMPVDGHPSMTAMSGSSCVFVAPTGWPPLALVVLGFGVLAMVLGAGSWWGVWVSGRSPPESGASLSCRVCVSRT